MQTPYGGTFDPRIARRTLALVSVATVCSVLSGTMTNIALPLIGRDLQVEPARLGWIISGFLVIIGISTPFYGRLADRFGARRLFVLGLALFSLGSLLCALAPSFGWLLSGRLVQATGSGAIPGLGVALVSRAYPPEQRGSAMGFIGTAVGSGAAIGPTLGGFIAGILGWQALFGVIALVGLLAPFAWRMIPAGSQCVRELLDLFGGVLLGLTIAGALLAATEASRGSLGGPVVIAALGMALAGAAGLLARQRLAPMPFIPRDLLADRRLVALGTLSLMTMAAYLPVLIAVPLLLTDFNALSPVHIGLVLLPEALVFSVLGPIAGRIVDRVGPRLPIRSGLVLMVAALTMLSSVGAGAPVWVVSLQVAILSGGFALVNSPLTTTISLLAPPARLASALSMNSMLFSLGGAFGTALMSAVLTARAGTQSALNPLYRGPVAAFSDAFLVLLALVIVAFGRTRALPVGREHAAPAQVD